VLIALLKESTTFCNPLVNAMTDQGMVQLMNVGPDEGARGVPVTLLSIHGNEVYGTIAVYLRLKGIGPANHGPPDAGAGKGQLRGRACNVCSRHE